MTQAVSYFISEAFISLWRRRRSSAVAVLTIAAAMAIPGAFLVLASNVDGLIARWRESAELSVFLKDNATSEQVGAVERRLDASGVVVRRFYVSKTEALRRFQQDFPDLGSAAADMPDNPLPASVEARLRPDADSTTALDTLAGGLSTLPGVADVRFDRGWLARVASLVRIVRTVGLGIAVLLAIAAALTVANVVRLAAYARRDEIEIMQLVGAPAVYVRGPFVAEGVIEGGIGAFGAVVLLWAGMLIIRVRYGALVGEALGLEGFSFLTPGLAALLVGSGMAIGCIGGFIAARGVRTS